MAALVVLCCCARCDAFLPSSILVVKNFPAKTECVTRGTVAAVLAPDWLPVVLTGRTSYERALNSKTE
jgi:hypothetical protein